jgi:hypothetical protein
MQKIARLKGGFPYKYYLIAKFKNKHMRHKIQKPPLSGFFDLKTPIIY